MAGPARLLDFDEADDLAAADVEAKADWRVEIHVFLSIAKGGEIRFRPWISTGNPAKYSQIDGLGRLIKTEVPELRPLDRRILLLGMPAIIRQDELKWYHTSKLLCVCSVN